VCGTPNDSPHSSRRSNPSIPEMQHLYILTNPSVIRKAHPVKTGFAYSKDTT
jgi:hypothetical protein